MVLTSEYRDRTSTTNNNTTSSKNNNINNSSKPSQDLIKELQDFCKQNAAPYKYPRKIQFVDPDFLPKTISGKIKRSELKGLEWSGAQEGDGKKRVSKL